MRRAVSHQSTATLQPGLYIVATPIGNLGDITRRAADVLSRCDLVACEDTRVTGKLFRHLGISKPLWRYDDHADGQVHHQQNPPPQDDLTRRIVSHGMRLYACLERASTAR